jgi:hypothetical protein
VALLDLPYERTVPSGAGTGHVVQRLLHQDRRRQELRPIDDSLLSRELVGEAVEREQAVRMPELGRDDYGLTRTTITEP